MNLNRSIGCVKFSISKSLDVDPLHNYISKSYSCFVMLFITKDYDPNMTYLI